MRREARILLKKSVDSLVLAVDHFNRSWDCGRREAVLIFLDRAFELLLKAVIVQRGGRIRAPKAMEILGFDNCLRKCLSDLTVKCLNEDDALTIQTINSLRNAVQHYILDISEQLLSLYTQAGFTLFRKLLKAVFNKGLLDYFPERIFPVSASLPEDLASLFNTDFSEIKELVTSGRGRRIQARAKMRAFLIIESSLSGIRSQPSENKLGRLMRRINKGKAWTDLFPGIATLKIDSSGEGINVSVSITQKEGEQIHLVPEGIPGSTVVAIKHVNELGFYSLGLNQLAEKLGISAPKTIALIKYLNLQESSDCCKEIRIGSSRFKRYSAKALDMLQKSLPDVNMQEVWLEYGPRRSPKDGLRKENNSNLFFHNGP